MKKTLLIIGLGFVIASCDSAKQTNQNGNKPTAGQKIMIPESQCFNSVMGTDTIWLKLEIFPNVVTGVLKYDFKKKDKSIGTIEGKLEGNKIFADYTFTSEGKTSVRQVAFLIEKNKATEGFGEMVENNGKFKFKDKSKIDFSNGIQLKSINCVKYDTKFRLK